ncbi:hypothetical protein SAMN05428975_0866 [Mucilaginibacter sp. OK268]|uniref:hypothetical protein n=1 Tax=Mucilaginibacter sp. OK268 TaxID=1881048 RepID=UPI00087FAFE3|nr:hypothetical protein [Mucilaginibacter sp. OK268]SDP25067.1 hypothetical protein SAMN05428975_0866 [Mucilaginibacter sp. OK268]
MLKMLRLGLLLLLIGCFSTAFSQTNIEKDSLLNFIRLSDKDVRDQKLVTYIKTNLNDIPVPKLKAKKDSIIKVISGYNIENRQEIVFLIESIAQRRFLKFDEAKKTLLKGIELAQKKSDHFLLYTLFSQFAFVQTGEGDAMGAIYSYGLAQNEVKKLNNPALEALLYVNISDIYYKSGLYSQSLFYLDKAQGICDRYKVRRLIVLRLISDNKAENFFRTSNYDSLNTYHHKLRSLADKTYKLYTSVKRTGYYLLLLKHNYKSAIQTINVLLKDSSYVKGDMDEQYLANAYFGNGQIDSAAYVVNKLLARPSLVNLPEMKFQLYEMLGEIAQIKNDNKLAADNFKLALQQSKQHINNLTQVGNVSSQMKINDVQSLYYENLLAYKKERLRLLFILMFTFLLVIVIAIFYRSNRQKRRYEKLLYAAQKQELATINSHEVRNHLSNILGLLDLMNDKDNKGNELLKTKDYLQYSAEQLDKALKNVSKKLSD